ncbi:MAG: hypothetical protein FWC40_06415 [Proteobacteria bacterium]|nr:hypothetical protein [Pseudomonadota bacterium]
MANERRPPFRRAAQEQHPARHQRTERDGETHREPRRTEDRKLYDVTCEQCRTDFRVPFEPISGRTLLCRDCLKQTKKPRSKGRPEHAQSGARERTESYQITCSHCGKHDTVPFQPYEGSVVLCRDCMTNPNVTRVGGRVLHTIICSSCGKENNVPFKPDPGSRVLCRGCHLKEREEKQRAKEHYAKHHPSIVHNTKVRIEIRCDKCGCEDTLPFLPKTHGQILCRQCAENIFGDEWARRNKLSTREYPFTCARCAAQDFVPFKPQPDKLLLCKHCLNNQAVLRHNRDSFQRHDAFTCVRTAPQMTAETTDPPDDDQS